MAVEESLQFYSVMPYDYVDVQRDQGSSGDNYELGT